MKRTNTEILKFANLFYQEHDRLPTCEELNSGLQIGHAEAEELIQSLRVVELPATDAPTDWSAFDLDEPLPIRVVDPAEGERTLRLSA
jgi:hypothetical protein